MKKKRAGEVDDFGRVRSMDGDSEGGKALVAVKKKKKKKPVERDLPVIEDNVYRAGKETPKKKKEKSEKSKLAKDDAKPKKKKDKSTDSDRIDVSGGRGELVTKAAADKKVAKKKTRAMQAIEEYAMLPPPTDEYDAETRRIFEQLVKTAGRLEEQMEDRIYNKDVYALNVIYSQIREIIADLRAAKDISQQIDELKSIVLMPYHKVCGQSLSEVYFHVEGAVSKFVKDPDQAAEVKKKLKNTIAECAQQIQQEFELALDRIAKVLA